MSVYITKAKSICGVNTFEKGALQALFEEETQNHAVHPNYREILKVPGLRRMSSIIRMALSCGLDVMGEQNPDAIIVGSGLGNLDHTVKFLDQIEKNENGGPISPTQFIQSTHNTIGGQLALVMKCYHYNMTHVQGGISFETALKDALWNMQLGKSKTVLVGAADENHPLMTTFGTAADLPVDEVGEGTTFFKISDQEADDCVSLDQCSILSNTDEVEKQIQGTDLVLYVNSGLNQGKMLSGENVIDISAKTKVYWSNSALATHLAYEILVKPELAQHYNIPDCKKIAVVNNFRNQYFGITQLSV